MEQKEKEYASTFSRIFLNYSSATGRKGLKELGNPDGHRNPNKQLIHK
jgi:hypothetical protein